MEVRDLGGGDSGGALDGDVRVRCDSVVAEAEFEVKFDHLETPFARGERLGGGAGRDGGTIGATT